MRSWLLMMALALACWAHVASAAAHGDRHASKERTHASSMSHENSKESDEAVETVLDEDEGAPERPEGGVYMPRPMPQYANSKASLSEQSLAAAAYAASQHGLHTQQPYRQHQPTPAEARRQRARERQESEEEEDNDEEEGEDDDEDDSESREDASRAGRK